VQEPMVGHIRLGWWREQIEAIFAGRAVDTPVGRALAAVVQARSLPRDLLGAYIDARALDLEETPFSDEAAMERHAVGVSSGVMKLAARVLGAEHRADDAARHAGIAQAYGGHLSSLGFFARRRRCRLPLQWLDEAGLNAEDVFAEQMTPELTRVVARLAGAARGALTKLRRAQFPTEATPALSAATLAGVWARRAGSAGFDPFRPMQPIPQWQRVGRIALANLTWRI
jgi:phytoene synthase